MRAVPMPAGVNMRDNGLDNLIQHIMIICLYVDQMIILYSPIFFGQNRTVQVLLTFVNQGTVQGITNQSWSSVAETRAQIIYVS